MERGNIKIDNPERFAGNYEISRQKIDNAIKKATDKLLSKLDHFANGFPDNIVYGRGLKYNLGPNNNWVCGMYTGTFILAYDLTGDERFLDVAKTHMSTYIERFENKVSFDDHDFGFVFSPATIAYYNRTKDEKIKEFSLECAEYFYDVGYCKKGGFIPRHLFFAEKNNVPGCRTMMDTMFNIPFFFWAGVNTGDKKFMDAGISQASFTRDYLIRDDGSSNHHYQFDINTLTPLYGVTLQGNSDDSTWSRGHSWGVYGFPIAFDYTGDESFMQVYKDVTAYMLNRLPQDNVLYWDFDFGDGSGESRDTSATIICACGMLEAIKYLPKNDPLTAIYKNAALMMIEAVIDGYTNDIGEDYDGLIWGVTCAKKLNLGIEGCAPYGDYFYLESLLRLSNPNWRRDW